MTNARHRGLHAKISAKYVQIQGTCCRLQILHTPGSRDIQIFNFEQNSAFGSFPDITARPPTDPDF